MAGSFPRVGGNPEQIAWMRHVEELLVHHDEATATTSERVSEIREAVNTVRSDLTTTNETVTTVNDQTSAATSTDRVPAPLQSKDYWTRVTLGLEPNMTAMNATATSMGVQLSPQSAGDATLSLTAVGTVPASRKFYVYAEATGGISVRVDWLNLDGSLMDSEAVTSTHVEALAGAVKYRFYATRVAGELASLLIKANVFEIIGTGDVSSLEIGPDVFRVIDDTGRTTVDFSPDLPLLAAPTVPTLETAVSAVAATWNGSLSDGAPGPSFSHVAVEYSDSPAGPWRRVGVPLTGRGNALIRGGSVGSTVHVRFIAIDRMGRESLPSPSASIVVEGIQLADVDDEITDAINRAVLDAHTARMTADGKNRIFVAVEAPDAVDDAPIAPGDQWWRLDVDDKLVGISVWNGATLQWTDYRIVADEIIVPGSIGGTLIKDGEVTTNHLAADSVDATKIQALSVLSEHITAGSIQVSHLEAGIGGALDISANDSINFLVGRAESLEGELAELGTVYRLTPDGAEISRPDSHFSLKIQNTGISMVENGMTVSYWNAGQMFVPSLVGDEVIAAHHKFEKYYTSGGVALGTVIRGVYG